MGRTVIVGIFLGILFFLTYNLVTYLLGQGAQWSESILGGVIFLVTFVIISVFIERTKVK